MNLANKTVLITGAAGFIGSNLVLRLIKANVDCNIIGVDNLNDYYDPKIKNYRLGLIDTEYKKKNSTSSVCWNFIRGDISNKSFIDRLFCEHQPQIVVNLAAQAGVRYSISNPDAYIESNIIGFYNILEACRKSYDLYQEGVEHLVYASSSSVYGANNKVPFSVGDPVDTPVSLYAATKKSNELFAHAYSKLYNIPATGLRFFTVYGPAGRPDMAYFKFTDSLVSRNKINIYNYGNCSRDFTYIDDIVEGVYRVLSNPPMKRNGPDSLPVPPYAVYNIGNGQPVNLLEFVTILQEELVKVGILPLDFYFDKFKNFVAMQPGDVPITYADTEEFKKDFGFVPNTPLRKGIRAFANWYKDFYEF